MKISSVIIILGAAFATALAQIVLKIGSAFKIPLFLEEIRSGIFPALINSFDTSSQMFHLLMIGTGFFLFMITLLALARGFKGGDMSVLYPIFATSFIWNILFSKIFLGENINIFKILGVAFIVGGIALIGMGQKGNFKEVKGEE